MASSNTMQWLNFVTGVEPDLCKQQVGCLEMRDLDSSIQMHNPLKDTLARTNKVT